MSLADLEEQGVLLPEEEWGEHALETTVSETQMAIAFALAVGSCILIFVGDGQRLTWIGVAAFIVLLTYITWLADRAVVQQRQRFENERARVRSSE